MDLENDQNFYDEIDIKSFEYDGSNNMFYYPCPCGDRFEISLLDLRNGEIIARCPSCSLIVAVIYEDIDVEKYNHVEIEMFS